MKKFVFFFLVSCMFSSVSAYEVDVTTINKLETTTVNAKLIVNREKKALELYFQDKSLLTNIRINPRAIRNAIQEQNAPVSKITIASRYLYDGTHVLEIENIESTNGTLDIFRSTQNFLKESQKRKSAKWLYDSFIFTTNIPDNYTIQNLPFYPQAPLETKENWSIHEESCEEASILLNHYITNQISFTPEMMNTDIMAINEFEKQHGIGEDKYSERYKKFFLRDLTNPYDIYSLLGKNYLQYSDEQILLVKNPTIETLRQFIANNTILTVPMKYTKDLRNKYIRTGKSFHIIDIVGYTPDTFITLDPGTKNGRYLSYPKNLLFRSIQENGNYFIALKKK